MATPKHTVVKGDTLSEIAVKYYETYKSVSKCSSWRDYQNYLAKINNIDNPNLIIVGQVLKLTGTSDPVKINTTNRATIKRFGLQSDTDRTMYATWTWDKTNTDGYQVKWHYDTGNGVWFEGSDSTVKIKQSLYTAPANALRVKFKVKPIAKTRTVNNRESPYWPSEWSTEKSYSFSDNIPDTPELPTISISKSSLTVKWENKVWMDHKDLWFQIEVYQNDATLHVTRWCSYSANNNSLAEKIGTTIIVTAGHAYKVRCRARKTISSGKYVYSDWSGFTDNIRDTTCPTPAGFTECFAYSEDTVHLKWKPVKNAVKYKVEYTTDQKYFGRSNDVSSTQPPESDEYATEMLIGGLNKGTEYFFRLCAISEDNEQSGWSKVSSTAVGTAPIAPTTYSSTATANVGEPLTLNWIHNCEDNSKQTAAVLKLEIDGFETEIDFPNDASSYSIDTSAYVEGTEIKWSVKTAGITQTYGIWSIPRTVKIYAPPYFASFEVKNSREESFDILDSFPFFISAKAFPETQTPIGYTVSIVSNQTYQTAGDDGVVRTITEGESVYYKNFNTASEIFGIGDDYNPYEILLRISAEDVNLENNIDYTVHLMVTMNSGLTAVESFTFTVGWTDEQYEPNAEIFYDDETYTTSIRPYCENENGELIPDVMLSVYRREFDGTFIEIGKNLDNSEAIFVTDPHPALDYARYRIVAMSNATGAISYYDVPSYPIGEKAIILQWDDQWTNLETYSEDSNEQSVWSGSLLRLPYNIDVSDSYDKDVEHVNYIGRKHPVSYYGTHVGQTSSWSTEIPKSDTETLYALRRLSIWTGDVYVREPSGSGYWASISVSFSQTHCELTIPVSIDITRVEGGA